MSQILNNITPAQFREANRAVLNRPGFPRIQTLQQANDRQNRVIRYRVFHQFGWGHGGPRVTLPECVVKKIRIRFPNDIQGGPIVV